MSLKDKIKAYIVDATSATENVINDNTLIFNDGLMDSMGFVLLLGFLEEEFNVVPSDDELLEENFESINAILQFITSKQKQVA